MIIQYDKSVGKQALLAAAQHYGSKIVYDYQIINGVALTVPQGKTVEQTIEFYQKVGGC